MDAPRIEDFFRAIKNGDTAAVEALLGADRDLIDGFDPSEFGATPLNLAASRGNLEMVDTLLRLGADIDRKSDWWAGGFAPIHSVFWTHHQELGPALIERGATVDVHAAAGFGMTDRLVELLDEDPARVHERGGDGQQPLHFAATPEIVDLLVARGADLEARDVDHESTPVQWAARHRPEVAGRLIEHGAATDVFLLAAIDDAHRLSDILERDPGARTAKIDADRFPVSGSEAEHIYCYTLGWQATPLHVAARCDRPRSIAALLAAGTDPAIKGDYDDCTPLHVAAWGGCLGAIEALLDGGAPIDVVSGEIHENEPLGWAIVAGKPDAVEALIGRGAPVREHHREQAERGRQGTFQQYSPEPIAAWDTIAAALAEIG